MNGGPAQGGSPKGRTAARRKGAPQKAERRHGLKAFQFFGDLHEPSAPLRVERGRKLRGEGVDLGI